MICSVYPNIPDLFWITINTHRSYFPSSKIYTQKASNSVILTFGCKFAGYIFTSDNIFHQLKVSSLAQNFITFNRSIFQLQDDLTYKENITSWVKIRCAPRPVSCVKLLHNYSKTIYITSLRTTSRNGVRVA